MYSLSIPVLSQSTCTHSALPCTCCEYLYSLTTSTFTHSPCILVLALRTCTHLALQVLVLTLTTCTHSEYLYSLRTLALTEYLCTHSAYLYSLRVLVLPLVCQRTLLKQLWQPLLHVLTDTSTCTHSAYLYCHSSVNGLCSNSSGSHSSTYSLTRVLVLTPRICTHSAYLYCHSSVSGLCSNSSGSHSSTYSLTRVLVLTPRTCTATRLSTDSAQTALAATPPRTH